MNALLPFLLAALKLPDDTSVPGPYTYYPASCMVEKRACRERLWYTVHDWEKYKDLDSVACQVLTVAKLGNLTSYGECVTGHMKNMLGEVDPSIFQDKKRTHEFWSHLELAFKNNLKLVTNVAKCAHDIDDCRDITELRECFQRHQNPLVA